jgi:hypothetical protein
MTRKTTRRSDMDAVYTGINWSVRRLAAIFAAVLVAALLAGGLGGYLIRGGASTVSTVARTTTVSAPALSGPFTESHDGSAAAPAGLTEPHDDGR